MDYNLRSHTDARLRRAGEASVRFRQNLGIKGTFLKDGCRERGLDPKIDIMGAGRIDKHNGIDTEGRDYDVIVREAMEVEFG